MPKPPERFHEKFDEDKETEREDQEKYKEEYHEEYTEGPYSTGWGVVLYNRDAIEEFKALEKQGIKDVDVGESEFTGVDKEGNRYYARTLVVTTKDGESHFVHDTWRS